MTTRQLQSINQLIIHCTATPNGRKVSLNDIDHWHGADRKARGLKPFQRDPVNISTFNPNYSHIGYHLLINTYGGVFSGRSLAEVGAHARGHNARSVGLCLAGTDQYSPAQWQALKAQCLGYQRRFDGIEIIGHNQINPNKSCPGFDVADWLSKKMKPPAKNILRKIK